MRLLSAALLLLASAPLCAQAPQPDIQSLMQNKVFFLRGMYEQDKLKFDATGQLIGKSAQTNPMRSAIQITNVALKKGRLVLSGERLVVYYVLNDIDGAPLHEPVQVEIAAPPDGDFQPALAEIFTKKPTDLLAGTRPEWQYCLLDHKEPKLLPRLGSSAPPVAKNADDGSKADNLRPPVLITTASSDFDASDLRVANGRTVLVVSFRVDACGNTTNVSVVQGVTDSLDKKTVAEIQAYRYKPAMIGDRPVAVMLRIVTDFSQIIQR